MGNPGCIFSWLLIEDFRAGGALFEGNHRHPWSPALVSMTKTDWLERLIALIGPAYFMRVFFIPVIVSSLLDRTQDLYIFVFRPGPVSLLPLRGLHRGFNDIALLLFFFAYLAGLIALWLLIILGPELLRQRPRLRRCLAVSLATSGLVSLLFLHAILFFGPKATLAFAGPMVVGWRVLRRFPFHSI